MTGSRKSDPVLRDLFATVTIAEAAIRWHISQSAVKDAIIRGKLDARKSGWVWLITTESLIRYWGKPDPPDLERVEVVLPRWRRVS